MDLITCPLNQFKYRVFVQVITLGIMNVFQIDYSRLNLWSHTDLAYIKHDPSLDPFIAYPAISESFNDIISNSNTISWILIFPTRIICF